MMEQSSLKVTLFNMPCFQGAGTAAHLMLDLWPSLHIEGWEIDEIVRHNSTNYLFILFMYYLFKYVSCPVKQAHLFSNAFQSAFTSAFDIWVILVSRQGIYTSYPER